MKKSFFLIIYILFVAITIFLFFSVEIPPRAHWLFTFIPLLIPIFLLVHLLLLIIYIFKKKYSHIAITVIILALGYKFYRRTFNFGFGNFKDQEGIELMSYNVKVFNVYDERKDDGKSSGKIINYCINKTAGIKCFQEFYFGKDKALFNTIGKLREKTPYYYFKPSVEFRNHQFGLAIFSRYPIIRNGEVKFPMITFNQAIYADIKIGKDTIRVYNVHLQSMSIDENQLPDPTSASEETTSRIKNLVQKVEFGNSHRTGQVKALLSHISKCPYPVFLAGDLNDTPYSYTYEELSEKLNNAFEEKGFGFGFTYNGKLDFLRIDNIFSDDKIKVHSFKTLNGIKYSDHFPIEVTFSL